MVTGFLTSDRHGNALCRKECDFVAAWLCDHGVPTAAAAGRNLDRGCPGSPYGHSDAQRNQHMLHAGKSLRRKFV